MEKKVARKKVWHEKKCARKKCGMKKNVCHKKRCGEKKVSQFIVYQPSSLLALDQELVPEVSRAWMMKVETANWFFDVDRRVFVLLITN